MKEYKPKIVKDPYDLVYCVLCWDEIPVGAKYHWIKSRSAGTRPVCLKCAEKFMKIYEDDSEEAKA